MDPKNTPKKTPQKKKTGKLSTPATALENVEKSSCRNVQPLKTNIQHPSGTLPPGLWIVSLARPPFVRIVRIVQLTVPHVTPHRASYLGHGGGYLQMWNRGHCH